MLIEHQKTVSREVSFAGPGLFSGETATLTIGPAASDAGITFVREQDGKVAHIPALVGNVLKRPRRTCLKNGTLFVETIEHCMAALAGPGGCNGSVPVAGGGHRGISRGRGPLRPPFPVDTGGGGAPHGRAARPPS